MKTKLFLTGLFLVAAIAIVSGQKANTDAKQVPVSQRGVSAGTNDDGMNNNLELRRDYRPGQGRNFYRGGRGNGPGRGLGPGMGNGYARTLGPVNGRGTGRAVGYNGGDGLGQGRGQGRFYSDTNNNGVCDYYENVTPQK